jgi:hypothetical protein
MSSEGEGVGLGFTVGVAEGVDVSAGVVVGDGVVDGAPKNEASPHPESRSARTRAVERAARARRRIVPPRFQVPMIVPLLARLFNWRQMDNPYAQDYDGVKW